MDVIDPDNQESPNVVLRDDEVRDRYVRALRIGVRLTLALLVVALAIYVSGLLAPAVPPEKLSRYWSLPADRFVAETGLPSAWDWTGRLYQGDVLSIVPAVVLASLTGLCMLSVLPVLARHRDRVLAVIIVLQIVVFVIAAWPGGR